MEAGDDKFIELDDYRERYVAFIDILGFKNMVQAGDTSQSARVEIFRALDLVRTSLCEDEVSGMQLTHFSDCIVLSTFRSPSGLLEMLRSIDALTSNLLQYDILVRGGLALGGAHHDRDILFGAGLNRAYELECKLAEWPRTLVAEDVIADAEEFSKNGWPGLNFITKDEDGLSFVNYLLQYATYDPSAPVLAGTRSLSYPARRIVDFACNRLNTAPDERVRKKTEWLQSYWNRTAAVNGVFKRIEAGVLERDHVCPTIIVRRRIAKG